MTGPTLLLHLHQQELCLRNLLRPAAYILNHHPDQEWRSAASCACSSLQQLADTLHADNALYFKLKYTAQQLERQAAASPTTSQSSPPSLIPNPAGSSKSDTQTLLALCSTLIRPFRRLADMQASATAAHSDDFESDTGWADHKAPSSTVSTNADSSQAHSQQFESSPALATLLAPQDVDEAGVSTQATPPGDPLQQQQTLQVAVADCAMALRRLISDSRYAPCLWVHPLQAPLLQPWALTPPPTPSTHPQAPSPTASLANTSTSQNIHVTGTTTLSQSSTQTSAANATHSSARDGVPLPPQGQDEGMVHERSEVLPSSIRIHENCVLQLEEMQTATEMAVDAAEESSAGGLRQREVASRVSHDAGSLTPGAFRPPAGSVKVPMHRQLIEAVVQVCGCGINVINQCVEGGL